MAFKSSGPDFPSSIEENSKKEPETDKTIPNILESIREAEPVFKPEAGDEENKITFLFRNPKLAEKFSEEGDFSGKDVAGQSTESLLPYGLEIVADDESMMFKFFVKDLKENILFYDTSNVVDKNDYEDVKDIFKNKKGPETVTEFMKRSLEKMFENLRPEGKT